MSPLQGWGCSFAFSFYHNVAPTGLKKSRRDDIMVEKCNHKLTKPRRGDIIYHGKQLTKKVFSERNEHD